MSDSINELYFKPVSTPSYRDGAYEPTFHSVVVGQSDKGYHWSLTEIKHDIDMEGSWSEKTFKTPTAAEHAGIRHKENIIRGIPEKNSELRDEPPHTLRGVIAKGLDDVAADRRIGASAESHMTLVEVNALNRTMQDYFGLGVDGMKSVNKEYAIPLARNIVHDRVQELTLRW